MPATTTVLELVKGIHQIVKEGLKVDREVPQ